MCSKEGLFEKPQIGVWYLLTLLNCSVTSGAQDIIQLEEWRKDRNELSKSLDNARQQVRTLKKPSKDPVKMKKQKDDFEVTSFILLMQILKICMHHLQ